MKAALAMVCCVCSCGGSKKAVVMPSAEPIDRMIEECTVVDGDLVSCPRETFRAGLKSANSWVRAAKAYEEQHVAVSGLLGISKEELVEQQDKTAAEKKKKYYWAVYGYLGGVVTVISILLLK